MGAAMVPVWSRCINKIKNEFSFKNIPSISLMSAFSFLIMMFNVPLPGGTTGHAVGAALIALLVGPYAACISISVALLVQALLFGDGGIIAFGANAFNMAFVMPFAAHYSYVVLNSIAPEKKSWKQTSIFIAAYVSIAFGALMAAVEFGIQPILFKDTAGLPLYSPYPLSIAIPAMMIPHLLVVGFIEAFITVGVYSYIEKISPSSIYKLSYSRSKPIYIVLFSLLVLCPLGLLASGTAWGEWSITEIKNMLGFIPGGMLSGFSFDSLMPDYSVPAIANETVGYIVSAVTGVVLIMATFGLFILFKRTITKKDS
jgi:cobalt/nickel transport system permease protein